jgi:DNA-binding XRE family transcriptional regulator
MKQLIKESGKTIEQLAKECEVSHVTIHKYMKEPKMLTCKLVALAKSLNVKPKDLFNIIEKQK